MDDQIQKLQVKLRKLNPHETFLYLVWKIHNFNFTFSAFSECHPKGWSICWVLLDHLPPKKDTNLRKAIPAAERLMLTMRFLASDDWQVSLSYLFRMGKKGVSRIVSETSEAIIQVRMTIPIHWAYIHWYVKTCYFALDIN